MKKSIQTYSWIKDLTYCKMVLHKFLEKSYVEKHSYSMLLSGEKYQYDILCCILHMKILGLWLVNTVGMKFATACWAA